MFPSSYITPLKWYILPIQCIYGTNKYQNGTI